MRFRVCYLGNFWFEKILEKYLQRSSISKFAGSLTKCSLKMNSFSVISQILCLFSGNFCLRNSSEWPLCLDSPHLPKHFMKKIRMQGKTKRCRKIYVIKTCTLTFLFFKWLIDVCTAAYLQLKCWQVIRWVVTNYRWFPYRNIARDTFLAGY